MIFSCYSFFNTHYYNSGRIYNNRLSSRIKFVWFLHLHKSCKGNICENFSFPTMASGISQKFSVYCDKVIAATSRIWTDKCTTQEGKKLSVKTEEIFKCTFKHSRTRLFYCCQYGTVLFNVDLCKKH